MNHFIRNFILAQCSGKAFGRVAVLLAAMVAASNASAHDFWIEPEQFRPRSSMRVPLRLLVGEHFKGDPALFVPEQFERYVYATPTGERNVEGKLGDDPAGSIMTDTPGRYVVGYYSKKFDVTFNSVADFEKYLVMEGLERNLTLAKRRASLRGDILEIYTRCAKSLLQVGAANGPADRRLGFPLELMAQSDPYAGERRLQLQLLYRGKPLEGALVVAFRKDEPRDKLKIHTDKNGTATFDLAKPGVWLITSVHMIPTSFLSRADWESFWASLTFELPR